MQQAVFAINETDENVLGSARTLNISRPWLGQLLYLGASYFIVSFKSNR